MPVALPNCNLANICQYGGKPKGDGTQGCSCFAAPDCSSTEKCPVGLGGEPKADGTNDCICISYIQMQKGEVSHDIKRSGSFSNNTRQIGSYKISWTGGLAPYICYLKVTGNRTKSKTVTTTDPSCSLSLGCRYQRGNSMASDMRCSTLGIPNCTASYTCSYSATVTDATGAKLNF